MEPMEAMYKVVCRYKFNSHAKLTVEPENVNNLLTVKPMDVNLHVKCRRCAKCVIVVMDLKEFNVNGPNQCCDHYWDISVTEGNPKGDMSFPKGQFIEEEHTAGILSVVGNFHIMKTEISDKDVLWRATLEDYSHLYFTTKHQTWVPYVEGKKKVRRMKYLSKKDKKTEKI